MKGTLQKTALAGLLVVCGLGLMRAKPEAEPQLTVREVCDDTYSEAQQAPVTQSVNGIAETPAADISGKYLAQWDDMGSGANPRKGFTSMNKITIDGTAVTIENFYNLGVTVTGTYDATNTSITMQPQVIANEKPYGDFSLCPFDAERGGFYTNVPLVMTMTADGYFESNYGWVVVVADKTSTYYGSAMGMSRKMRMYLSNATISGERRVFSGTTDQLTFAQTTIPTYVYSNATGELCVANLCTNGVDATVFINPDSTYTIEPTVMAYLNMGITWILRPVEWSATKNKSKALEKPMTGKVTARTLDLGSYGIVTSSSLTQLRFGMQNAVLTLGDGVKDIVVPSPTSVSFTGEGTEASPYLIKSTDDMALLQKGVAAGDKYTGQHFRLDADLDYAAVQASYRPIGSSATICFDGAFDGNNHTIKNLRIEGGARDYNGIFGYLGDNGSVRNLKVLNSTVSASSQYNGIIAGYSKGKISNVTVTGNARCNGGKKPDYLGGIAGYSRKVTDCEFTGNISGYAYVGGITGCVYCDTISNCRVNAVIESAILSSSIAHNVGGVVGGLQTSPTEKVCVSDSYFMGSLSDKTGYANMGGVIGGNANNSSVERCASSCLISTAVKDNSTGSCGGVIGYFGGGVVEDCFSSASIIGANATNKVGGLVGVLYKNVSSTGGPTTMRNCYFAGQIRESGEFIPAHAIHSKREEPSVVENVYYDWQITTGNPMGADDLYGGKSTTELTDGTPLKGFDTAKWDFKAGRYPVLKGLLNDKLTDYFCGAVKLANGQKVNNLKTNFTYPVTANVQWRLMNGNTYVQETEALKLDNGTGVVKGKMGVENLTATVETEYGSFTRLLALFVAPPQFEGEGTAEKPYIIRTVEDLRTINKGITQNNLTYDGDFFELANDLDFTGETFYGVADDSNEKHAFNGVFDGKGHVIKNWKISSIVTDGDGKLDNKASRQSVGFFGIIGENGVLKNLVMDSSCELKAGNGVAAFSAICKGRLENLRNHAAITAAGNYAAGIVCRMAAGSVTDCYNDGSVTAGNRYAAGIVGQQMENVTVERCQNAGDISMAGITLTTPAADTQTAAGIVANNNGTGCVIRDCVNSGRIYAPEESAGIIALIAAGTKVERCVNTGALEIGDPRKSFGAIAALRAGVSEYVNCYYDASHHIYGAVYGDDMAGVTGLDTKTLVAGSFPEGLGTDAFDFSKDVYPVLKNFKDEAAVKALRGMWINLSQGDVANQVTADATLSAAAGLVWSLPDGTTALSVNGPTLKLNAISEPANVVVTGTCGAWKRPFALQAINNPFKGTGSKEDPYQIATLADFQTLSSYTNDYGIRYNGKYFAMLNDVDFGGSANFKPVSWDSSAPFLGVFDGRNHKITNVTMTWTDAKNAEGHSYTGIFGYVGKDAEIRNIELAGGNIQCYTYAGGIVGRMQGLMENCVNRATVKTTGTCNAGGVVGSLRGGTMRNCSNYGEITSQTTHCGGVAGEILAGSFGDNLVNYGKVTATRTFAGGIAPTCAGLIVNCVNHGEIVAGTGTAAGIASSMLFTDSTYNHVNYGTVTITNGTGAAGIAAEMKGPASHCYNYAPIQANGYAAGIVGSLSGRLYLSSNRGAVTGVKTSNVGGVAAYMSGNSRIDSCANYAAVKGANQAVGGIVGNGTYTTITVSNCENFADVTATTAAAYGVGGVVGRGNMVLEACVNYANVSSESYGTGGILGDGTAKITGCVNFGKVTTTYDLASKKSGNAGGIAGNGAYLVSGCINHGDVTGLRYVGGVMGLNNTNNTKIQGVYTDCKVTGTDAATTDAIAAWADGKATCEDAYYLQEGTASDRGSLVTRAELNKKNLGENFVHHEYALPTPKGLEKNGDVNIHAVDLYFKDGESADNFISEANVAALEGLTLELTDNLSFDGNVIKVTGSKNPDQGKVTVKSPRFTREMLLTLKPDPSGINGIGTDDNVVETRYFTLDGLEIAEPTSGQVVIERALLTDGTVRVRKVRK